MKKFLQYLATAILFQVPTFIAHAANLDSFPNEISNLSWEINEAEIKEQANQGEIEHQKYTAYYFKKYIDVQAMTFAKTLPIFGDAQITVESVNERVIGIRVSATDINKECWNLDVSDRPKECRQFDLAGMTKIFDQVKVSLEKQYGSASTKKISKSEKFVQWKSKTKYLTLSLDKGEYDDGWSVGLSIERR